VIALTAFLVLGASACRDKTGGRPTPEASAHPLPTVTGLPGEDAVHQLVDAGFCIKKIVGQVSEKPVGRVLAQSPRGGSMVSPDDSSAFVTLWVVEKLEHLEYPESGAIPPSVVSTDPDSMEPMNSLARTALDAEQAAKLACPNVSTAREGR
jgi:hypothetical protein